MHGRAERHGRRKSILIEEVVRQDKPLRVDREAGIIRDMKVLGFTSGNGREYLPDACARAMPLYEGIRVNVDHPFDANGNVKPNRQRSSYDRLGKFHNVRVVDGDGVRADFHFLKSHPLAETVCEAAERMPDAFGFSHNADGEGYEKGGRFIVEEITRVRSVDLVAEPATTKSLLEGRDMAKSKARKPVTEMGDEDLYSADAGMGATAGDGGGHEDDLFQAFKKLKDSDPEKANKILAMLKAERAGEEPAPAMEEDDSEDEDEEKKKLEEARNSDGTGYNNEKEKRAMYGRLHNDGEYSKSKAAAGPESKTHTSAGHALTEAHIQRLCRLAGVPEDKELVETILATNSEEAAIKFLEWAKSKLPGESVKERPVARTAPRSTGPGTQAVTEGTETAYRTAFQRITGRLPASVKN